MRARNFAVGGETVWQSLLTRMLNLEGHHNVLGLKEVIQDERNYYIVMTRCSGGELFDFLQTETDVPERECKRIMREILEAVDHIHSRGLIHRDIKPENIMFHDTSNEPNSPKTPASKKAVKLIDFDTCLEYEPKSPRAKHVVGTLGRAPSYLAPEALQGDYSPASDLWSVGVILYILMTGDMPFDQDCYRSVISCTVAALWLCMDSAVPSYELPLTSWRYHEDGPGLLQLFWSPLQWEVSEFWVRVLNEFFFQRFQGRQHLEEVRPPGAKEPLIEEMRQLLGPLEELPEAKWRAIEVDRTEDLVDDLCFCRFLRGHGNNPKEAAQYMGKAPGTQSLDDGLELISRSPIKELPAGSVCGFAGAICA
ncbi:Calcium-dependent protein kinase 29 (OsCDPK29) (OsCPK29) [Durusdinium trenchii]|uniref:Calcium-dependent protein kinase 29 (OsCDPK29) (OsCPK29) n=1 Tax=Durusdinium trenchii TaxID=1381693 RepID=A0ABP0HXN1_9DINO